MKQYDYLIVGAGFSGAVFAYEMIKAGKKVLVIDKNSHVGGNCYTEQRDDIHMHMFGPHIFNTSNKVIWDYINQFAKFNNFVYSPVAKYRNELYSLPFNMWTFNKVLGVEYPIDAQQLIRKQSEHIIVPTNLEEQAIKLVGVDVYEKLIKGYTEKQWKKSCIELPKEIIQRLPVRFTYDNNFYHSTYQGIPIGGYTQIFEKLLEGIEVRLNVDYFKDKEDLDALAEKTFYTGPVDLYYDYKFGPLEYKTTRFLHYKCGEGVTNFQGIAVVNYTEKQIPYTRVIEHKHFEKKLDGPTWITFEYPEDYVAGETIPMYPVNDKENNLKYNQYKELVDKEKTTIFSGRLASYKYYNMDQVIEQTLNKVYEQLT